MPGHTGKEQKYVRCVPNPEGEVTTNPKRVAASERMYDSSNGIVPEGQNPMGVAGMKQGRQATGGSRPRERKNAGEAP